MSIKATKVASKAQVEVTVHIDSDETFVSPNYHKAEILPYLVTVLFRYEAEGDRDDIWMAKKVQVSGYKVLKPGPNGERRVSDKQTASADWYTYRSGVDLPQAEKLPSWLVEIIDEVRPFGHLDLTNL